MAPKKKKAPVKPKNQKEAILQNAQNAIQERLKTTQQSPLKPDAPKSVEAVEPADSDSSDDEDFNPDVQPVEAESSSSEDEAEAPKSGAKKQKAKRKRDDDDDVDAELASGDEGIILQRTSKRHKKGGDEEFLSDDEGGEAGFIKTRAQRRTEQQERRPLTQIGNATADVDAIWARLAALPIGRPPEPLEPRPTENEEDYITIHRTTKFAGQVTTEERRVLKTSQEAKVYLAEQEANKKQQQQEQEVELADTNGEGDTDGPAPPPLRRPLFRKSRFEPNPTGEVKALPPHLQLRWPRDKMPTRKVLGADENATFNPRALPTLTPAAKLNTVQKSKYDWAGYVDKAGIAEELDQYGKSKQSYAERTGFLNRLEGRKEEERLAAKRKVA
ncbi:hypothetical protein BLS_000947 [Venturia inaequalis]|uniref:SWR1-complex protein 5 n=1 Tax=Venturia inaequalis TaxID=5025 RepID=A0A8H3Z4A8_VENIN|nr:hypothetical protein BLS_000947 [Venturia inaequalis]KAE9986553.1 hypothetical protein EG327_004258 [Venturia inaequalis]